MLRHQVEYDHVVAINRTSILQVLDTQLRFCELAKWYVTYPVDPVKATNGSMPRGLC